MVCRFFVRNSLNFNIIITLWVEFLFFNEEQGNKKISNNKPIYENKKQKFV